MRHKTIAYLVTVALLGLVIGFACLWYRTSLSDRAFVKKAIGPYQLKTRWNNAPGIRKVSPAFIECEGGGLLWMISFKGVGTAPNMKENSDSIISMLSNLKTYKACSISRDGSLTVDRVRYSIACLNSRYQQKLYAKTRGDKVTNMKGKTPLGEREWLKLANDFKCSMFLIPAPSKRKVVTK